MILKKQIREIIHDPHLGPHHLEFVYKKLTDEKQREDFLFLLKELVLSGSEKEKAACFITIEMIGKADDFKDVIRQNIDKISYSESYTFINSLLWLSAAISEKWGISFIKKAIQHFRHELMPDSSLFKTGIRCIVATAYWREEIDEIIRAMENYSDNYLIDFVAYFRWRRGKSDLEELFKLINDNGALTNRINHLKSEIENRYINNYSKLPN